MSKAAEKGHLALCKLFITNTEDKNPEDNLGWTPLHYASENGFLEVCKLIIAENRNTVPVNGRTALHRAAAAGHYSVCELLVQNMADKNPPNAIGTTAEFGHISICQFNKFQTKIQKEFLIGPHFMRQRKMAIFKASRASRSPSSDYFCLRFVRHLFTFACLSPFFVFVALYCEY